MPKLPSDLAPKHPEKGGRPERPVHARVAERQRLLEAQEETNRQLHLANVTLRESEEKLAVTLHSIGDAVIATDADACVTLLNPLAEQLTGWPQAEAVGRLVLDVFRIINQETRQPATVPVADTLAQGTIHGLANHTIVIARDGRERSIADSCAPIRDRDGRVIGAVLVFRDVTEEYESRRALSDSTEQMRTLLNTVVDGIITFHAHGGVIQTVNPAAERMFGYTTDALLGRPFSTLIPELSDDAQVGAASLGYYSASAEARAVGIGREVMGRRSDGRAFPMELTVSEMWLGNVRYFTAILRDISARKHAEDALRKAGALQRAIFESANFSSIATDARGVIQIFNVGAERMLGFSAADVTNTITPADISDPQELVARAFELTAEFGTPITPGFEALVFKASRGIEDIYELTYIRKDGTRLPAVVSVTALRDADDAIIGYLLIGTDNTARKQVEEEQKKLDQRLRDQQFYTRSLIESNVDALVATDTAGIITDLNKQMESLTGCTRDELIGAPFKDFFTDPNRAEQGVKRALSEKKVTNYELTAHDRDGNETPVSYSATTFYDRARTLQGVFAAVRDITEQKRLDRVLLDKHVELESARVVADLANHAKSDFLSSMSHELRSPLNAILGFAQLLESDETPPLTPGQRANVEQILSAGWYLLQLINEVLDLAVVESGKLSLSVEPVPLGEVLDECHAMIEPQAKQRSLSVTFSLPDRQPFVAADRIRLKQTILNLLSNAIKYNRMGGAVTVDCVASPGRVRVRVRDTGLGLTPAKLTQLFQPFNRLGQASTIEGTGIGLVMSKLLVELMGGNIGVDSVVGVGSVFWFELCEVEAPIDSHAGVQPELVEGRPPGPHRRTLLYIEDNSANLKLVEQLIARRPDMHMLSAADASLGIAAARYHLPDVILMDINLPGMNGIQAMNILRDDPVTAHIPILAISANAMLGDIRRGVDAGFLTYLTKPINVVEFMNAIDQALDTANARAVARAREVQP